MKKIFPFLLAFLFLLPVGSAFADYDYTQGYFDNNQPLSMSAKMGGAIDNNELTKVVLFNSVSPLSIVLKEPINIQAFYLSGLRTESKVAFYDLDGNILHTETKYGGFKAYVNLSLKGVKKIEFHNTYGDTYVNEFELFEVEKMIYSPVTNLSEIHNHNSVTLSWVKPTGSEFKGVIIKKDGLEITKLSSNTNSYTVNGLESETSYVFDVIAEYSDGTLSEAKTITSTTGIKPVDVTPPNDISNLSVVKTHESANFVFTFPVDSDFSHVEVYRDGNLINDRLSKTIFNDVGLVPNTSYVYKFVSVDIDGNKSTGFIQTVLTDSEKDSTAPVSPLNVNTTSGNSSGRVFWKSNTEKDIQGYNLFVNGVKYNSTLILSNNYTLSGLANGESYSITVTAVDTSGNESLPSNPVSLNPIVGAMPIIESKFDLKQVADGTNNWFMSLWPILAFSVGITLAFIVSRRVKLLFFA